MAGFLWIAGAVIAVAIGWLLFFANRQRFPWAPPQPAPDESRGDVTRTTILIPTPSGDHIEAWLHRSPGASRPVIVMAPGLAGTKEGPLERFAWAFAEAGFTILSFDFRSFGGSAGLPRHDIDLRNAAADFEAVVSHIRAGDVPGADPHRIILWGTSFSGAAAICTAATLDPPPAGMILHVPYLGKPAKGPGPLQMAGYIALVIAEPIGDATARLLGLRLSPVYIAAYGKPGERAFGASRDCPSRHGGKADHAFWKLLPETYRGGWRNLMLVRALQSIDALDPARALKDISVPVLTIAATHDDMICIEDTRALCAANPRIALIEISGGHFDPYIDPHFGPNIARQIAFAEVAAGLLPPRELEATNTGA